MRGIVDNFVNVVLLGSGRLLTPPFVPTIHGDMVGAVAPMPSVFSSESATVVCGSYLPLRMILEWVNKGEDIKAGVKFSRYRLRPIRRHFRWSQLVPMLCRLG